MVGTVSFLNHIVTSKLTTEMLSIIELSKLKRLNQNLFDVTQYNIVNFFQCMNACKDLFASFTVAPKIAQENILIDRHPTFGGLSQMLKSNVSDPANFNNHEWNSWFCWMLKLSAIQYSNSDFNYSSLGSYTPSFLFFCHCGLTIYWRILCGKIWAKS